MRTFIAVETSKEQKEKLAEFQEALKKSGADLKIVEKENLHLTLRFLGEISEKEADIVKQSLSKITFSKFQMHLKGAGAFPNLNHINVIWAGVSEGAAELQALAEKINEIKIGQKDERGFSVHITVARAKSASGKENLLKVLKEFANFDFGSAEVSEIKLKESKLGKNGPTYSDLAVFPLG